MEPFDWSAAEAQFEDDPVVVLAAKVARLESALKSLARRVRHLEAELVKR